MKNLITIGLPSKGRLKEGSINFLSRNNLKLTSNGGERNYFAEVKNFPNIKIIYLHAKEIIQRIGDGTLDIGISGLDLLNESATNLKQKIDVKKKLDLSQGLRKRSKNSDKKDAGKNISEKKQKEYSFILDIF